MIRFCRLPLVALALALTGPAFAQVVQNGPVTVFTPSAAASAVGAGLDFANAKPMPMPTTVIAPGLRSSVNAVFPGPSGVSAGGQPSGGAQPHPVTLPASSYIPPSPGGAGSEQFGTSGQVFTTSRVNAYGQPTSQFYPFSAAGRLFFNIGSSTFVCTASLIKPGVIVTAAHCVANFGKSQFYTNWTFYPAFNNNVGLYGGWSAKSATVLTSYFNGTDSCAQAGVICQDDVAVIDLKVNANFQFPGNLVGWLGYGWNGYSYNGSAQAEITQLGLPVALDNGAFLERTDSQGFTSGSLSNNTIIGSLQTGGSSGGPWVVNLGRPPVLNGTAQGTMPNENVVVGVTSWGYIDTTVKQQGAAPFTSSNIVVLVNVVCTADPTHC